MEPVINNVLENGTFYRLVYSNSHSTLNSLILKLSLHNITISKAFNKYKLTFDTKKFENIYELSFIKTLEDNLLAKFNLADISIKNVNESININNIKLYSDKSLQNSYENLNIYLKISGIWVKNNECGLTYKFFC
jgi:hypothetical protein